MKSINFYEYYNENQVGSDCTIVAALNASLYLHKKKLIKPKTKKYDKILKLTGCVAGAAIRPDKCYPLLKIKINKQYGKWYDINFADLPLELGVWHSHYGFHSILVTDYCVKTRAVQVLNLKHETTTDGWVFLDTLKHFIYSSSTIRARSYKKL